MMMMMMMMVTRRTTVATTIEIVKDILHYFRKYNIVGSRLLYVMFCRCTKGIEKPPFLCVGAVADGKPDI